MGNAPARMSFLGKLVYNFVHLTDKIVAWHKLPVFFGLLYLGARRYLHDNYSLINVGGQQVDGVAHDAAQHPYRTEDGRYNDPSNAIAGSQGAFFGRNMLPSPQEETIMKPDPVVVASKLLARRELIDTGKQFNMIAASWIQFMIHDWVDHLEDTHQIELETQGEGGCPVKAFRFYKTKQIPTGSSKIPIGHANMRTSWWDGSVIYGSNAERLGRVRTFKDGKLIISDDGLIPHDKDGVLRSGDIRNSWVGVSVLQALFVKEHNAVCDMLKANNPELSDEQLYRYARLVTSAVIAKVHTIDWTVELLKTDTLRAALRVNWYGLLGKTFKDRFGHVGNSNLSGFPGHSKAENHGVPYSLTEEFVGVYRMHPLLPEKLYLRDTNVAPSQNKSPSLLREVSMEELIGLEGEKNISKIGFGAQMVSMGHQPSGALELWNYPQWMTNLIVQDIDGKNRVDPVNLAALEIYRDRERSVARYNEFRRNMFMIPIKKWEDLTDNKEAIKVLREVYGEDIESLDLLVGLMAEKKIKGFAISETAFFIFLIMASRRLEGDRFFTSDYNEKIYTEDGLKWVDSTESLKDVLSRHYPQLIHNWMSSDSAFSVWDSPPSKKNYIPIYLRFAN